MSKTCLVLNLTAEGTSTQVEAAFIDALRADRKAWLLGDDEFVAELHSGHVPDPELDPDDDRVNDHPPIRLQDRH